MTTYIRPGEGRRYPMIDGDHIAKTTIDDANGRFEVFEVHAHVGPMAPPHVSPWTSVLYLLDGCVTAPRRRHRVRRGAWRHRDLPGRRTLHLCRRCQPARFLAITSGERAGRFFADFASSVPCTDPWRSQ